jgi:deoxyribodipyrimidine photo-lyase
MVQAKLDSEVPELRVRAANGAEVGDSGEFVLYWMTANRRTRWNYSLQRAIEWATALRKPLVVLEALRCGYEWANDRFHAFVIQGMADNAQRLAKSNATYYPYLEWKPGEGRGLIAALSAKASVVVGDDYPCFFLPHMLASAAKQIHVRFELVDSNGLLPMRAAEKTFARAFDFRRFLQKELREHLVAMPHEDPFDGAKLPKPVELPAAILKKWPVADVASIAKSLQQLANFPIDHEVAPAPFDGGPVAAEKRLADFLKRQFTDYAESRNHPDEDATSRLSPYLHFGHISSHEVFFDIMQREKWSLAKLSDKATGSSSGWWGVGQSAEGYLDQLVTWRELGFNMCSRRDDFDRYESLPDWAQKTLKEHTKDRRQFTYTLDEFTRAETHDPLWNAAQRQLVREGRIHNYLRMLWGKKILEWTAKPQDALAVMIELNNRYALDGRDPNSYSGIFWILGRYDRAWGPERPIFGKIRYMSSDNTARKLNVKPYLEAHGPNAYPSL